MMTRPHLALLLGLVVALPAAAAEAPQPGPELAPEQVVEIQLDALQHNDEPEPDAGIARTWTFAHPDNRAMTGPLERFTAMLKTPAYSLLLDHRRHSIEPVGRTEDLAVFLVTVVSARGPVVTYRWTVRRVTSGPLAGAWMTAAVSPPIQRGQSI